MNESRIVVKKVVKASPEEVFEAFTDPAVMAEWFCPFEGGSAEVRNSLEVGGEYRIVMYDAGGASYKHIGEYTDIEPPVRLVFTWNSDYVQGTVVSVDLAGVEGGTEVTITHDMLPTDKMREDHRRGWTGCLNNLEKMFA